MLDLTLSEGPVGRNAVTHAQKEVEPVLDQVIDSASTNDDVMNSKRLASIYICIYKQLFPGGRQVTARYPAA